MPTSLEHFKLYDTDIQDLLWGGPAGDILCREPPEDYEGVFDTLQEKELIYSIYQRDIPRTHQLLNELTHTLSPKDAMAACLCALSCPPDLLSVLLDHCPPIPDFQFQGEGNLASLLNVAVDFYLLEHLDLLLNRGADPNGGPTPNAEFSPLEFAFCSTLHHSHGYYDCLKRLLEAPGIRKTPTESILTAWGQLEEDWDAEIIHSCQLLYSHITGQPADPNDPLPYPPQMTLSHTLWRGNRTLAARISGCRPITEEDRDALLKSYAIHHPVSILHAGGVPRFIRQFQNEATLINNFLTQYPDTLPLPEVRSALAAIVLSLPEQDSQLQRWVAQMADGPIFLQSLPINNYLNGRRIRNDEIPVLEPDFFPRWDARLGSRLIPALRPRDIPCMEALSAEDTAAILWRVRVLDDAESFNAADPLVMQVLQNAEESVLMELLQSHDSLESFSPDTLLDACQALPLSRRSLILPHLRKQPDYGL